MAPPSPKSDCRLATNRAYGSTIGLRIRTSRHDGASARCSVSNRPDQPNASCLFTPPSKTLSTSSAISHPAARSASSEKKLSGRGELRQPHELELGRADFPWPIQVHVTEPFAKLLTETERARRELTDRMFDAALDYKLKWEQELERRERLGITGPAPLPHPDDVRLN